MAHFVVWSTRIVTRFAIPHGSARTFPSRAHREPLRPSSWWRVTTWTTMTPTALPRATGFCA